MSEVPHVGVGLRVSGVGRKPPRALRGWVYNPEPYRRHNISGLGFRVWNSRFWVSGVGGERSSHKCAAFRGGLAFKARRLCVSLNSRLESNAEEEKGQRTHRLGHDGVAVEALHIVFSNAFQEALRVIHPLMGAYCFRPGGSRRKRCTSCSATLCAKL